MSEKIYRDLVTAFCSLVGINHLSDVLRDGNVSLDGVVFSLVHDEGRAPGVLSVFCDLGPLPSNREREMCKALMEANLLLFMSQAPVLCLSQQTGNVTMAFRLRLDAVTPEALREILFRAVSQAKEWRAPSFLDALGLSAGESLSHPVQSRSASKSLRIRNPE